MDNKKFIQADRDINKEFTQEQKNTWCIENDFPIGFFEMPVDQRRKELYAWSKRHPCPDGILCKERILN